MAVLVYDITQSRAQIELRSSQRRSTCSSGPIIICRGYLYYSLYSCQDSLTRTRTHAHSHLLVFAVFTIARKVGGPSGEGAGGGVSIIL